MVKFKAYVVECNERKYEGNTYYQLMCNNPDENEELELGLVSSVKPYVVGSTVYLTLKRDKEFRYKVRVAND